MTFPTIPTGGRILNANQLDTTATRTFPSLSGLTKNSGDLLIAVIVAYQTSTGTNAAFSGWTGGFTEFHDSATSSTLAIGCAYKWSTGSETGTFAVTQAGTITGDASMFVMSIADAHASTVPEAGSRADGTTALADPASFNPSGWDVEDTLWVSVVGSGCTNISGTWTGTGSTAPTNFSGFVRTAASDTSTVGDCEAAVSFRQNAVAAEDVGTASGGDISNSRNAAIVIAVRPAVASTPTITQAAYRFYDDGTETGSTALAAQDTAYAANVSSADLNLQLRMRLQTTNAVATDSTDDWQLQYDRNASGSWTNVTTSTSNVAAFASANITDAAVTTNRLGAGTGSFVAGEISETGLVTDLGWTASNFTEVLYSLKLKRADLLNGDVITFRVLRNGATTGMTYTATPTLNITGASPGDIVLRSAATSTSYTGRTTTTINAPTGIQDGDLLVFCLLQGSGTTPAAPTPPAGLTQIGTNTSVGSGFIVHMRMWYKRAASESGSYSFTHPSHSTQGFILCYSGVHTSSPFDVTHTTNTGTGQTSTALGLTTSTAKALLVYVMHDFGDAVVGQLTPPTGMTERVDVVPLIYAADEIKTTAGATGNRTQTNNNNVSNPWATFLLALRPAPALIAGGGTENLSVNVTATVSCTDTFSTLSTSVLLNHVAIAAPRIPGDFTHTVTPSTGTVITGSLFTPTAGRFLLCVVNGGMTSTGAGGAGTAPAGWALPTNGDAVTNTGLYVYYKNVAAGGDNIVTTHNGSGYPAVFDFYEFPAGTTFVAAAKNAACAITGINPILSGLTGTNFVMAAKAMFEASGGPTTLPSYVWDSPNVESLDTYVLSNGVTGGYMLGVAYTAGYTGTSYQPTATLTTSNAGTTETLTWAVNVPAAPSTGSLLNHVVLSLTPSTVTHVIDPMTTGTVVTGTRFTPTAGRLLVAVTHSIATNIGAPPDWSPGVTTPGDTFLYTYVLSTPGVTTLTLTHNFANLPMFCEFFEFPAGSSYVNGVNGVIASTAANPNLTGLSPPNFVMAAKANFTENGTKTPTGVWDLSMTETLDAYTAGTDSTWFSTAYLADYAGTSFQPTCTVTGGPTTGATDTKYVSATWAINVQATPPVPWLNHVSIAAPRMGAGVFTHTINPASSGTVVAGAAFTPTAGRYLLCVVEGAVTTFGASSSVPPTGWFSAAEAIGGTGLYVFNKTAAGGDTMAATHNGANYPVMFDWYEFPAGTTFVTENHAGITKTAANPTISGLTGTNVVMAAKGQGIQQTLGAISGVWNLGLGEALDSYVYDDGVTNGYWLGIGYLPGYTGSSFQPTCTVTSPPTGNCEALTWAVHVSVGPINYVETGRPVAITATVTLPSEPTGNPIPAENALSGYAPANWQIPGLGDGGALGFTTAMSVQAGSAIDFKIHTGGVGYALEIIRLGWYGGNGARLVQTFSGRTGVTQPEGTLRTQGEGGVGSRDCSNWSVTDTWTVPSNACHGIYLGVIKRTGQGTYGHVGPFVVHTTYSNTTSKITVKLSDMTWRAYNSFGTLAAPITGKSLYGPEGTPPSGGSGVFVQSGRAWDVTYDAPLVTASGVPQTSYWNGEQPVHTWLERNGYDVSYVSCLDVDSNPSILLGRSVIVSLGHDEYWSQNMRDAWDAAIASGVNAIVFSGNTMLWRVRMVGRLLVCYKNSHSLDGAGSGIDPVTWTGTWRDTRWSSRNPENRSIGTMFVSNGIRNDEYIVTATNASAELWRGTTAAALTGGSTETLKTDALGMEWDSYEPYYANSMRYPAGLKLLSLSPVNLTGNSAGENGSTYTDTINPANHYIVAFKKGTSLVVNFGANQWGWGLSDFHARGATGENTTMKQATINLLADMGLQPTTIQSGLTPATLTAWTFPTASTMSTTATMNLGTGASGQLAATTTWSNGITTDNCDYVTWGTDNSAVATVSATGLVTAIGAGTATITGTYSSLSDTTAVTVTGITTADTYTPLGYSYTGTNYDPGSPISVAARFQKKTGITQYYVKGVRWWRSTYSQSSAPVAYLSQVSGTIEATKTSSFGAGGFTTAGWEEFIFTTPVLVTGSGQYVVWVWVPSGGYAAVPNFFDDGARLSQLGLFTAAGTGSSAFQQPPTGTNGNTEPTDRFNTSHYLVEPLVVETLSNAYNETGRQLGITATVTAIDQADWKEPSLTNAIIATIASTGLLKLRELALSVPMVATVTATASAHYKETTSGTPPVVYTDDFNRADTTTIVTGGVGLGPNWDGDGWHITSNKAERVGSGADFVTFATTMGSPDHYVEADYDQNGGAYCVVNIRRPSATNIETGYLGWVDPGGAACHIGKEINGSFSSVPGGDFSGSFPTTGRIRLEVQGTLLTLKINGATIGSTNDATITTGNYVGMNGSNLALMDNFAAGPVGVGGATGLSLPIAAAVTSTDLLHNKELVLSVPVAGTTTTTDLIHRKELALSVPMVATVTTTDQADFKEGARSPASLTYIDSSTFSDANTPKTVAATWSTGETVIVWSGAGGANDILTAPTVAGLTFTLQTEQDNAATTEPESHIWTAVAASSGSGNISISMSGATIHWGFSVWRFPAGSTLGVKGSDLNEAVLSLTVGAGSAVVGGVADWNATAGSSAPATGSGTATERMDGQSGHWRYWTGDWVGVSAGAFGFGIASYAGLKTAQSFIEVIGVSVGLQVAVTTTVTVVDTYHAGSAGNNETGRSITIVGAVTATDQADFKEPGLALPVAATAALTDKQLNKELGLSVPITATVTLTAKQTSKDLVLSVPVTGTVTVTDFVHRKELALSVPVAATTTMAVDLARLHETALSVSVTATITVTDSCKVRELGLSIPVTGTTTLAVDRAGYKNLSASVPITCFVTVVDLQQLPGHYDETQRSILITGTTTLPVDRAKYGNLSTSLPVAASVTTTDTRHLFEPSLGIAVVATVSITTLIHLREAVSLLAVAMTTLSVDQADFEEHPVSFGITATVTCTDLGTGAVQNLSISMLASVATTDRLAARQLVMPIDVSATTVGTDSLGVLVLLSLLITAKITGTDFKSRVGIVVLNDADAIYLGDETVDAVYVGADRAWP